MSLIAEKYRAAVETKALRPISGPPISYQIIGGSLIPIVDNSNNYITRGYGINDIIYSIINLILDKVRQAPWSVYEVIDDRSLKSMHAIQRKTDVNAEDLRKSRDLQLKAFKPVKNPGKWGDLLTDPNEQDNFQELVSNGCGFKMLTGNKFLWANMLDAGANAGYPQELWTMPSQWMQVIATLGFPCRVLGYNMPNLGLIGEKSFQTETILHEKYFNYEYTVNGAQLMGMAPLKAGLKLTNRNNSALDVSTSKFQNGGLESIIYLDEQGVDKNMAMGTIESVKQKLISEYTGVDNYGKIAGSGYKLGALNLGLSPVELAIIDAEKWDLRRFCNLFGGVPSQLLNDPDNKTYNNQKEGEKALTSRCGLALLSSFRDTLNRKAHRNWKLDPKWIIDFDATVYSELQQDVGEMMKWLEPLAKLTGMSPNMILDLMGLEKMADAVFNEPWIRTEMGQPLSEWKQNDVDSILNQGNDALNSGG